MILITDNVIKVMVEKTAQGLGLSVTGGLPAACPDASEDGVQTTRSSAWIGLIRIKKIFPHGAAWQTGKLNVGDVLLAADGIPLTGCTNYVSFPPSLDIGWLSITIVKLCYLFRKHFKFFGALPA